jgi:hypothetical protein
MAIGNVKAATIKDWRKQEIPSWILGPAMLPAFRESLEILAEDLILVEISATKERN